MPDLLHTLQGNDLAFLKMVANAWGLELEAPDARSALPLLVNSLLDHQLVSEMIETLPGDAQGALQGLLENEGQMVWAQFTRRYGEVRKMGPAMRDRERPDLNPASAAEALFYRALIGRTFLNLPPEPQEYAYIPDELLELLEPMIETDVAPLGRPASPKECAFPVPASDRVVDHACTLLAALRSGIRLEELDASHWLASPQVLKDLLFSARIVDASGIPLPDAARSFLESSRAEALAWLARAWIDSERFNELRQLPGLLFEGDWTNNPRQARRAVMDMLSHTPSDQWWSLPAFTGAVHERAPDFQRPAGDYDSWFIRQVSSENYLRGFGCWNEIDGALIRHLITGPMHWLGILDLALPAQDAAPAAFRFSAWAEALWHGQAPSGLPEENAHLRATSDGRLRVPVLLPRQIRYQIARFCRWDDEKQDEFIYRITPASLERARKQGLKATQLVALLRRYSEGPLPPTLIQALDRWEQSGSQVRVEKTVLLRFGSPEILPALQRSRASRGLGEVLNATTVTIKPGCEQLVIDVLSELGHLADTNLE